MGVCGWSVGGLWVYGRFELWMSRCGVEGVGVGGVRCRGVGVCGWSMGGGCLISRCWGV